MASIDFDLVSIAAGEFTLGAHRAISRSVVPVRMKLTRRFHISRFLVTQRQWFEVMATKPWTRPEIIKDAGFCEGGNVPVVGVNWNDATSFCLRLSEMTGKKFRLPTEAEWEYSIRGGTQTEYFWGDDICKAEEFAYFWPGGPIKIREMRLSEVGSRKPNPWGLYDMAGLVQEWVYDKFESEEDSPYIRADHYPTEAIDFYSDQGRLGMLRNGSFRSPASVLTSYYKILEELNHASIQVGFRVVLEA
jgi:formylglycine-generating enzyme required for sulfatase activity